jgi:hypothetical protein
MRDQNGVKVECWAGGWSRKLSSGTAAGMWIRLEVLLTVVSACLTEYELPRTSGHVQAILSPRSGWLA